MAPPLLAVKSARLRIGRQQLLDGIDAAVAKGDRIGLVGRNGAGKSTLLRAMAGEIELDEGERFLQPRTTVAYLPQEPTLPAGPDLARIVLTGLPAAEQSEAALHRAEIVLADLGLDPARAPIGLSGGETRRVALARMLVAEPDLLLLDEPTNHLDLETIEWLEQRIAALSSGIVLISHDRAFLERMTRTTWWIDRGRMRVNEVGYAGFEAWAEQVLAAEEAELARLDKKLLVEADWLHKGVTARRKRNQGRLRNLMALRDQRRRHIGQQGSVKLDIQAGQGSGQLVIEAKNISKSFADRPIVKGFSTRILRRDRIGIIGPNGAGKTTLLKLLTGELQPDEGSVRLGTNLEIARFDQLRTALDPEKNLWETLCPAGGDKVSVQGQWRHVAGYLRDFLFRDEQLRQPVKALSGGERNRLLLAKTLAEPANLLILDEPTNDLDLDTLELLEESLADYPGTLLLVSHDRRFLDNLVTSTIVSEGRGRWSEYAGGYSDWLLQRAPVETQAAKPAKEKRATTIEAAPRPRAFDAKLVRELERLPEKIRLAQERAAAVEQRLDDPGLYARDPEGFTRTSAELTRLRDEVATLEERWLELEMQRERAMDAGGTA